MGQKTSTTTGCETTSIPRRLWMAAALDNAIATIDLGESISTNTVGARFHAGLTRESAASGFNLRTRVTSVGAPAQASRWRELARREENALDAANFNETVIRPRGPIPRS